MRRSATLAFLVAAAIVASLAATIPGALAGSTSAGAKRPSGPGILNKGEIVTGVVGGGCVAVAKNDACMAVASIFPRPPGGINPEDMGIAGGLVENPYCAGDINDPAPAPGVLCIYPAPDESVNLALNGEGSISAQAYPVYNGKYGFKVIWNAAGPGSAQFSAVWVYQAP